MDRTTHELGERLKRAHDLAIDECLREFDAWLKEPAAVHFDLAMLRVRLEALKVSHE